MQRALKHWLVISSSWTREIEFVQCLSGCDSVNAQLIMLGDVFRGKAPSTLTKRANSMKFLCEQLELVGHEFLAQNPHYMAFFANCDNRDSRPPSLRAFWKRLHLYGTAWELQSVMCS